MAGNKGRLPVRLSSDAKCNTPRRFDIGKVVQDLRECCHAILFASSDDERDQIAILRAAGRSMGAIARLPSLERTSKSASLNLVALRSGLQGGLDPGNV
jgi:hypothetical protein